MHQATSKSVERVLNVADVAERIGPHRVAHEPEQVVVQGDRNVLGDREELIFLLAQPPNVVGDVDSDPSGIGLVGAAAVVDASEVHEYRPLCHLGGDGVFLGVSEAILSAIATDDHAGCSVLLGEVRSGPDGVALHLVVAGEWEEIERPLIAMYGLRALPRLDGNDLSQMKLMIGGVTEDVVNDAANQRMHDQISRGGRTGNERTRSFRQAAAKVVSAVRRCFDERIHLSQRLIDRALVGNIVDHDSPV